MIYITGDCHGDFHRFNTSIFPEQNEMTKDDYMIICGDFGGIWNYQEESSEEKYWLKWLEHKPFTTLFIDGNHENFDRLYKYPEKEWNGGKVHEIRPSILHLMRGQVFTLQGKTFFTFGGASSHDIQGGILEVDDPNYREKRLKLLREDTCFRTNHHTWWKEELPSQEEMNEGLENLKKHNNKVNFIVTHCCSTSSQEFLSKGIYKPDIETDYLEKIKQTVDFDKWFFGHYHDNKNVSSLEILIYEGFVQII